MRVVVVVTESADKQLNTMGGGGWMAEGSFGIRDDCGCGACIVRM